MSSTGQDHKTADIVRRLDEIAVVGRVALDDELASRQAALEALVVEIEQLSAELEEQL